MERLAVGGRRLAVLTPLPPAKTGVAHYSSMLLPALRHAIESDSTRAARHPQRLDAFGSLEDYDSSIYDQVIYQLGNNPHHAWIYEEAMRRPGVIVLHDLVLHHLIVEMTLACGDADAYVAALEANHGPAGAAWARGRAAGLHSEMGNFLLPASVSVAQRSKAVIVHNQYAADRLRSFGVTTPIHVVPHPHVPETRPFPAAAPSGRRVIGFFGFLTSAKRAEIVLEAFHVARQRDPRLELLIVGEPAPNIDLDILRGEGITLTGYVEDDEFPRYYALADRFVNLRYPTAGETSGTLIRALDAGKPVAVSDYAQFAELPDDVVFKVPLGEGEVERLVDFMTTDLPAPREKQRAWLNENASLEKTAAGYLEAIRSAGLQAAGAPASSRPDAGGPARWKAALCAVPLFPQLQLVSATPLVIRNAGNTTIRTRSYGQPEYRLIARLFAGDRVVQDRWLALPKDLRPGETATIDVRWAGEGDTLRLYHALQDVPDSGTEPWESVRVR